MTSKSQRSSYRWLPVALALALVLISCQLLTPASNTPVPAQITPAPATEAVPPTQALPSEIVPTQNTPTAPVPTNAATQVPTVEAQPVVTPAATSLSANGPWLLLNISNALWATNSDGSGLTPLTLVQDVVVGPNDLFKAVQPGGRMAAYITGDIDRVHNLTLKLVSLPDGEVKTITRLTNANTEPGFDAMMDDRVQAVRAITDIDSLSWSPDGKMLAFIGVQDGPSADLYTYSVDNGQIRRLTDGPSQGYGPHFSPDGRFIVHFGVNSFGTGAGYSMAGGWSAWASGAGVNTLFTGGGSGQDFAGWVNDRLFLINAWKPDCGAQDLRVMSVADGTHNTLLQGCFSSVVAAPGSGNAFVAGGMSETTPGLWLINSATGEKKQLLDQAVYTVTTRNVAPDILVGTDNSGIIFGNTGEILAEAPQALCNYGFQTAGYGLIYAWTCSEIGPDRGVWINGPGLGTRKVFESGAGLPMWAPDNTLLFVSGQTLYKALFLEYVPTPVTILPGEVRGAAWVGVQ